MKFIIKIFFIISLIQISIFAYIDSDFDGVEDSKDKCPNSSIVDIVDKNGCLVESLESLHHFDIILGTKFIKVTDKKTKEDFHITLKTAQVDYLYKNFSFNLFATKNNENFEDTYISLKYKYKYNNSLTFYTSVGALLPTNSDPLNNNSIDYSLSQSISYKINDFSFFTAYKFTIINDTDIENISVYYQNTNTYIVGIGYNFLNDLSSSISISNVDSIYKNQSSAISTSVSLFYSIDKNWFINPSFTKTYNDKTISDTLSFKIGYYY